MAGLNITTHHGPKTFAAEEPIKGGQVVMAGTSGVLVATAAAANVLGVALVDAAPEQAPVDGVLTAKPAHTSVAYGPAEVELAVEGTVALGDKVAAAADGAVGVHAGGDIVGVVTRVVGTSRAIVRLTV